MPNIFDDWNLYLKIKQLAPIYLQPAFLYKRKVLTIHDLQKAAYYLLFCGYRFTYDEMQEAIQVYQKQFFQEGGLCLNQK